VESEQEQRARLRDAFDLVLRDVRAILGTDVVGVYFLDDEGEMPRELHWLAAPRPPGVRDCDAYAYVRGDGGGVGYDLEFWRTLSPADAVVRVADDVQELIVERSDHFARSFPPCPDHAEPLWPEVVDGRPAWRCTRGGGTVIPIGEWPTAKS
jgi:hypothetical protein